jgi:hypothetical protein
MKVTSVLQGLVILDLLKTFVRLDNTVPRIPQLLPNALLEPINQELSKLNVLIALLVTSVPLALPNI